QMAAVFGLAAEGMVSPPVESVRPFEEAAAVIQAIADRQVTGKAVVTI
ncbi:MAG TPA: NADPH:quinone reductase, partial [Acidimicrobiaceae bacterium]|nr:NADPH:quinone reductase [Acidimicrobiaceae bacterium]